MVRIPVDDITNFHYNFVVAKPLVSTKVTRYIHVTYSSGTADDVADFLLAQTWVRGRFLAIASKCFNFPILDNGTAAKG